MKMMKNFQKFGTFYLKKARDGKFKTLYSNIIRELEIPELIKFREKDWIQIIKSKSGNHVNQSNNLPISKISKNNVSQDNTVKTNVSQDQKIKGGQWKWESDSGWIEYPKEIQDILNKNISSINDSTIIKIGDLDHKIVWNGKGWIQEWTTNPKIYRKVLAPN